MSSVLDQYVAQNVGFPTYERAFRHLMTTNVEATKFPRYRRGFWPLKTTGFLNFCKVTDNLNEHAVDRRQKEAGWVQAVVKQWIKWEGNELRVTAEEKDRAKWHVLSVCVGQVCTI